MLPRPRKELLCLGVNYHSCPLAVREHFAVSKSQLAGSLHKLLALPAIAECVLLSTCNRTEIIAWGQQGADLQAMQQSLMQHYASLHQDIDSRYFYSYEGRDVLRHLAELAAGLDSMILGETEIFGQLKEAYRVALQHRATAGYANRVFQRIFSIAKRVRHETRITQGPTSIGAAAVQVALEEIGSLEGKRVLLIGAGDVARSTAQSLRSRGAEALFVANRSYDRAVELAEQVGGSVIRFSEWLPYFEHIDIAIVSTASPVYVVQHHALVSVQEKRDHRPLLLMDLSVPRNVDPRCGELTGIHLHDIDSFEHRRSRSTELRHSEIGKCRQLIEQWLTDEQEILLAGGHSSYHRHQ